MYVNGICIQLFQNLYSQCQENENIQCKTMVIVIKIKEIKTELREVVAKLKQTADRMVYIESTGVKTKPVAGVSSREKRIDYGMSLRHGLV